MVYSNARGPTSAVLSNLAHVATAGWPFPASAWPPNRRNRRPTHAVAALQKHGTAEPAAHTTPTQQCRRTHEQTAAEFSRMQASPALRRWPPGETYPLLQTPHRKDLPTAIGMQCRAPAKGFRESAKAPQARFFAPMRRHAGQATKLPSVQRCGGHNTAARTREASLSHASNGISWWYNSLRAEWVPADEAWSPRAARSPTSFLTAPTSVATLPPATHR